MQMAGEKLLVGVCILCPLSFGGLLITIGIMMSVELALIFGILISVISTIFLGAILFESQPIEGDDPAQPPAPMKEISFDLCIYFIIVYAILFGIIVWGIISNNSEVCLLGIMFVVLEFAIAICVIRESNQN